MRKLTRITLTLAFFSGSLAFAQLKQLRLITEALEGRAGGKATFQETFWLKDESGKVLEKYSSVGNGTEILTNKFSKLSAGGTLSEIVTGSGVKLELQRDGSYFAKLDLREIRRASGRSQGGVDDHTLIYRAEREIQRLAGRLPGLQFKYITPDFVESIPVSLAMGSFKKLAKPGSGPAGQYFLSVPIGTSTAEVEWSLQRFANNAKHHFYYKIGDKTIAPAVTGALPKSIESFEAAATTAGYKAISVNNSGFSPTEMFDGMLARIKYYENNGTVRELTGKVTQDHSVSALWALKVVQDSGKVVTLDAKNQTLLVLAVKAAKH